MVQVIRFILLSLLAVEFNHVETAKNGTFINSNSTTTTVEKLHGNYSILKNRITLSGLSAGGSFAQILHLSYSNYFDGIGIFAAFFYRCGNFSRTLEEHYSKCGKTGGYPIGDHKPNPSLAEPSLAIATTKEYARLGLIEPLENLAHQYLYIWQGTEDEFIRPDIGLPIVNIYEPWINKASQIYTKIQYSHHHFPSVNNGVPCEQISNLTDAYIGKCKYNGAHYMLKFIIGKGSKGSTYNKSSLKLFNQAEFFEDLGPIIGFDDVGYMYIPSKCDPAERSSNSRKCFLHFYFHGCFLTRAQVGSRHIEGSGLLEAAEQNNIIMIFPMANVTSYNSGGCFDFFGYTGPNYANKKGIQPIIMERIIKRLIG